MGAPIERTFSESPLDPLNRIRKFLNLILEVLLKAMEVLLEVLKVVLEILEVLDSRYCKRKNTIPPEPPQAKALQGIIRSNPAEGFV